LIPLRTFVENMQTSFISETELPGRKINKDTLQIIAHRYYWTSKLVSGKEVLEVGCGPSLGMGWLSRQSKHVVGGDLTKDSLKLAKKYYGSRVDLVCMDAHRLPIKDNCLDAVVSLAAIIYMDFPVFLDECHRVLKSGGMLIVNTPNRDIPGFRPSLLSHQYYSVPELHLLLNEHHFNTKLFGAFSAQQVSKRNQSRFVSLSRVLMSKILKSVGLYHLIKRAIASVPLFITLKEELGDKEMRLVENIEVVPLSSNSSDQLHRIVYAVAQPR
jgi:ubiquinone/menaquinone biosynthesis C-methylase UbiE